jgi:hypothetical protein
MAVRTRKNIDGHAQLRIEDDQRFSGQGPGRRLAQRLQAMLAGG